MLKPILTCLIALFTVSSCVISTPFKRTDTGQEAANIGEQNRVIVALTHATLKQGKDHKHNFYRYVDSVVDSMEAQQGMLGYSIRRQLFGREAWTMTVWQDQDSLLAFKTGDAHSQAMQFGSSSLESAVFAQVEISPSEIPLKWAQAEQILEQQGRRYEYN